MSAIGALGASMGYRYSPPTISPQMQQTEMGDEGEEISVAESDQAEEVDTSSDESSESSDTESSEGSVGAQLDVSA